MNYKPILFNTTMVTAILSGKKTQTRRIIKPQPDARPYPMPEQSCYPGCFGIEGLPMVIRSPYQIGDTLWVRETWGFQTRNGGCFFAYRADGVTHNMDIGTNGSYPTTPIKWHPSIHMPKRAARIFLRVTDVRAARVQDIDYEGCRAEGIWDDYTTYSEKYHENLAKAAYPIAYSKLWNDTVKKSNLEKYGWAANPWVWVIEFERIDGDGSVKA